MAEELDEDAWTVLLERVRKGQCTPFLGAGASTLPKAGALAERWAGDFGYPLNDRDDLARVAQFVGLRHDMMFPKDKMVEVVQGGPEPDFDGDDEPHRLLADLALPIYITTNYDDFMFRALEHVGKRPRRYLCCWNSLMKGAVAPVPPRFVPDDRNPLVFHLHGQHDVRHSLVLTEDDYLDFLVAAGRFLAADRPDRAMLPHQIERALTGTSLLFVGYRLADWTFRVLFRGLVGAMEGGLRSLSVAVQLEPSELERRYLHRYFSKMDVKVFWGDASQFLRDLHSRLEEAARRG
jgi:hypothetical protein